MEHVRSGPGTTELGASCDQGEGSPEGPCDNMGFANTGEMHGKEVALVLKF